MEPRLEPLRAATAPPMKPFWNPLADNAWPVIAEALAKPWPREAAEHDCRVYVAVEGQTPSRRALAARWGWSENKVREVLAFPERWWNVERFGPAPEGVVVKRRGPPNGHPLTTQPDEDERGLFLVDHPLTTH